MSLIVIDVSSYNSFRTAVLDRAAQNLGFDVDNAYGYQCWDLAAELWMNLPEFSGQGLYPKTGPNLYAEECWTYSRTENAGSSFDLIYNYEDVKRGDCIVIGSSSISLTGHIAFADEDYNGNPSMILLGQNQVNPDLTYGHIPTLTQISVQPYFLGAFRNKDWETTPPSPTPSLNFPESTFPWVLMSRKLRNRY